MYLEVIDMGFEPIKSAEYTFLGRVTEFKYGLRLSEVCLFILLFIQMGENN
jgi:alpha-amylase